MSFKVDIELDKYRPLLFPEVPPDNEIININADKEDCVWKRQVPDVINYSFLELEKKRLRQGAYIIIKDTLIWLPPNFYHFLENGIAGTGRPQFRLKELKNNYFKLMVRANPYATGTFDMKNRQDGRTTRTMSDALFELQEGVNYHGQINIQSKTDRDAYMPNWVTVKSQWLNYPKWLKDLFYSDFASGNNIETQMRFTREEREIKNNRGDFEILPSRNMIMTTFPAVFNAQDGSSNVLKCIADEFCKWVVCSPAKFLTNSTQFMQVGATRKGLYEIFSSPSDVNHRYLDEVYKIWQDSNPENLDEFGATKNGLWRLHSNPLDGMEGFYDKFGDADADEIYKSIMYKRSKKNKDELLGEVRANPLNESEMFSAFDANKFWDNIEGIKERKLYVMSTIYKDEKTREPKYIWGNLEFENGVDGKVNFRPNEKNEFDIHTGRFCFSELPNFDVELNDTSKPPKFIGSCIGADPYHLGLGTKNIKNAKRRSTHGAVNWKFRELGVEDFIPRPTFIYDCRPAHPHITYMDMIKAAIFLRAMVQYEPTSDEMERFFNDNGYGAWILNSSTYKNPTNKTEIGRGKRGGAFMAEVKSIINILTNVPINPDTPYILNQFWFEQLLEELIEYREDETSKYNLISALGQSVWGAVKISKEKKRTGTTQQKQMLEYFLS